MKRLSLSAIALSTALLVGACATSQQDTTSQVANAPSAGIAPALFDSENVLILLESEQEAS